MSSPTVPPTNVVPLDPRHRKSHDIECLRCGTYNIPENKNCGRCGASLPVVYDEAGKVFNWGEAQGFNEVMKIKSSTKSAPRKGSAAWILRMMIIFIAILFAIYILRR